MGFSWPDTTTMQKKVKPHERPGSTDEDIGGFFCDPEIGWSRKSRLSHRGCLKTSLSNMGPKDGYDLYSIEMHFLKREILWAFELFPNLLGGYE